MYVLVRKDLPASQIVVQASHAAIDASRYFLRKEEEHPHLIVCQAKDELGLLKERQKIANLGIEVTTFYESDRNGEATAFATEIIEEEDRDVFRRCQLLKL
jgi:hypothetical protein